ncbi:methyltransferase family protein [Maribellus sediminis]|uniref:methyltransferase family protein n=1 Tax=Maribellus sediminis TaxID=2696285 RepID=UPI001430DDCE|nr:isoprenylcysteine carboxylmethyltransferase family protein [Maribellus sediminis]
MILNSTPFAGFLLLVLILISRVIHLRKQGIQLSSVAGRKNKLIIPVFALIFLFWMYEIVKPVFQISVNIFPAAFTVSLFDCQILIITGSILILVSLILWTITLIHFKISLRFGLDNTNNGKLVTSGIFSVSRNPFFLSLDVYFLGTAMVFFNLFFMVFTILALVGIHFFILKEEHFLAENYGEEYKEYQQKTRRYL